VETYRPGKHADVYASLADVNALQRAGFRYEHIRDVSGENFAQAKAMVQNETLQRAAEHKYKSFPSSSVPYHVFNQLESISLV